MTEAIGIKTKGITGRKSINTVLIAVFVFWCVFFPADFYSIKKLSFAMIVILNMDVIANKILSSRYRAVLFIAVVFPIGTILHSLLLGSSIGNAIGGGYAGMLFLILIVTCEHNIDYERILLLSLRVLCAVILLLALLDATRIMDINAATPIRQFIYDKGIGVMGKSPSYAMYYKIFLKTSPLLIILLYESFENNRWLDTGASFAALLLSGTRANIFVSVTLLVCLVFLHRTETKHEKNIKLIVAMLVAFLGILMIPKIIVYISQMMNVAGSISSDAIRSGQIQGLVEKLSDPIALLFGAGYGNPLIYDYGRGVYVVNFEWAYFALLLKVGIIWFTTYMIFLAIPVFAKVRLSIKVLHLGYLAITVTNPLLYSSTAMLMFIYIYNKIDSTYYRSNRYGEQI